MNNDNILNALRDVLDCFWDMSPLEYAKSRGLPYMSDEEGENVLAKARAATQQTHPEDAENAQCPVCGYYCLGKGGHGCIDKPGMLCKTCEDFKATEQTGRCPSCGQPALRG